MRLQCKRSTASAAPAFTTRLRRSYVAALCARALWVFVTLLTAACGDSPSNPIALGPPAIEIVYQGTSNERPLTKLMLHNHLEDYAGSPNLLASPLGQGQHVVIKGFAPDDYYLTVLRKHHSTTVSDMIALTTETPLSLRSGRFEIWVFDESFRVFDPTKSL